jgi:hypothetical protein
MTVLYFPEYKLRYVRIPKNACSTVINSLGHSEIQGRHPHQFSGIFEQAIEESNEWPCIVVLRDPYERVISAYLNKFTNILPEELFAHELLDYIWRAQRGRQRPTWQSSVTFREFVTHICSFPDEQLDKHWRSQSSFLASVDPSIWLETNNLSGQWEMHPILSSIELRSFVPHATHSTLDVGNNVLDVPGEDFLGFKKICGVFPSHKQFSDSTLHEKIQMRFSDDYALLAKVAVKLNSEVKIGKNQ